MAFALSSPSFNSPTKVQCIFSVAFLQNFSPSKIFFKRGNHHVFNESALKTSARKLHHSLVSDTNPQYCKQWRMTLTRKCYYVCYSQQIPSLDQL